MTDGLKRQLQHLSEMTDGTDEAGKRRTAIGTWAAMVGALILARMAHEEVLSDEILRETRAWITAKAAG